MFLDVVGVAAVVEVGVDFHKVEAAVVVNGNPVEDVAVVSIVTVEAEVVPVANEALREDGGGDDDDTPPFLKMILIVACRGRRTTHGRCSLADY
jgi:hypothetical protein